MLIDASLLLEKIAKYISDLKAIIDNLPIDIKIDK